MILLAGIMAGNCMLPMKFSRRWKWENTWLVFSLVSLVLLPWALALLLAGDVLAVYRGLTLAQWLLPFALGAGWGIAQVLFGLSIARLGLALGCAVIIGLGSLFGTLVPLFFKNREVLATGRGALILFGLGRDGSRHHRLGEGGTASVSRDRTSPRAVDTPWRWGWPCCAG